MCGIFGCIRRGGVFESESFRRFAALTDTVSYRGPDGAGYLALNNAQGKIFREGDSLQPFDVFLGHRRLSIIDLSSAGQQPMTDHNGHWIIFNGEIFNFIELREELKSFGYEFKTETDTEVILHLYDKYGEAGFEKMNGMWALAIADLRACRVVLSRDRFSIKPLYLLEQNGDFYFASEIKQLLPLLPKKQPNFEVLSAFIAQGLLDHSLETFFCGITRLPPKMNLVVNLATGTIERKTYWEYAKWEAPDPSVAQEEFRELLIDSTKIRLRSDVKVGLLLSGGLDSSALAVAVRQAGAVDIETYSVVSDEPQFSEESFVDTVNSSLGLSGVKFRFQLPRLKETLLDVLRHGDEPFAGLSVVAQYGIFDTIKKNGNATVLLSGQGGDEVLLGYLKFFFFYLRELIRERRYTLALTQIIASAIRRTVIRQFRISEAKRYIPYLHSRNNRVLRKEHEPIRVWTREGMRSRQITDIDLFSVPALTHYEDRNSMAHSLEVRHPFLDHRLVNFAINLPPDYQFERGWTKSLLRRSFPELPDAVRWRKDKQPFTTPEELWLKHDLRDLIECTFQESMLDKFGLLDAKRFLKQYSAYRRGHPTISFGDISRTFIAELWAQQHWN